MADTPIPEGYFDTRDALRKPFKRRLVAVYRAPGYEPGMGDPPLKVIGCQGGEEAKALSEAMKNKKASD